MTGVPFPPRAATSTRPIHPSKTADRVDNLIEMMLRCTSLGRNRGPEMAV